MTTTFKFARTAMLAAPLALAAGMASAGGLAQPVETVAPTPMAPAPAPMMAGSDWSGFYVGGQLGYGELTSSAVADEDFNGAVYGVHAGYMYDLGSVVLGAEIDYDLTSMEETGTTDLGNAEVDDILRVKARVGYDAGAFLPYVTGGVVRANVTTDGVLGDLEADGDFYGLGAAYKFSDSILIGGEVLQHKFYEGDVQGLGVRATTATARVSFQF
ncbi:outer membrane protein [Yoonia vestfoldensis]|uniref:outer membrane protein n=1 Tax=Yoonia vestfoldensis TaxID=245188 RepID=UPI00036AA0F8|nr:outer membrane beta-barrel protein [Yoonia vestfoldensis]